MNRRNLLAFAACFPALATPAGACSVALTSPRVTGLQNERVRRLFAAWWERDASAYRAILSGTPIDDAGGMESHLARDSAGIDPVPPESLAIFDLYFARPAMVRQIHLMVNNAAGILVACSEARARSADPSPIVEADCSGMPQLHLFLVTMSGLNPRLVTHIATEDTVEPDKMSIWMEGSA